MRSSTLFGIYATVIIGLLVGLAGLTLYSLEKSRWWDARTQLAQESFGLHLKLEANLYRLFKQHGDALLIGDRDGGKGESALKAKIAQNLADIRTVIAREIQMAGEEEIEELELLDEIERDIQSVNAAIATLTATGDPIETFVQIERLAALLDGDIDDELDRKIQAALEEELEEVEEVIAESAAFRTWNKQLVYLITLVALATLMVALVSFNGQIRQPLIRLSEGLGRLRNGDYSKSVNLGGSREFRDLGGVLDNMAEGLAAREVSRAEQKRHLEETVAVRTAELQQLIDKLETGEENRKQLMADISHELRTPLAIILGEADVTLRTSGKLSTDVSDSLARIRDSAKHTNQIVDDMLTVARFEAGQLRLDRKETDLRKVLRDAVAMFPGQVEVESPNTQICAPVDEVRLRQSVLALLQNARRYGGPTILAKLEESPTECTIAIEDDGPGLSTAEKSQAFDRFFRGSNASGQGIEGSGLGLPVVRSIVEAHGGTVDLLDRDEGGLKIVIALPKEPRMKIVSTNTSRKTA
ncbi:HAMP domain-containing sensor histidine kinase [Ruegeria sp. HKCCD8929]|uniref:sensor histidine kinase n=1 Tax=Ruegeria sp. HKCCD8929 TaxID=2683006 RepID=UPI00148851AF|nr:HAMP domain-containing sensor histidine kinase [Ruegeria sp. HKCCD8929]